MEGGTATPDTGCLREKNMDLDYVRYFVKLTEVKHYTRAAEKLCISQPSLSHAMRQLEGELGVE